MIEKFMDQLDCFQDEDGRRIVRACFATLHARQRLRMVAEVDLKELRRWAGESYYTFIANRTVESARLAIIEIEAAMPSLTRMGVILQNRDT